MANFERLDIADRQIGLTEEQSRMLQILVAQMSKGSPLVQMGEEYDLVLKSECSG